MPLLSSNIQGPNMLCIADDFIIVKMSHRAVIGMDIEGERV